MAIRAQADARLALAAAAAIDPGGWQRHEWHDVAGPSYADTGNRVMGPAAARPRQCWHLASQGRHSPAEHDTGGLVRAVRAGI